MSQKITVQAGNMEFVVVETEGDVAFDLVDGDINLGTDGSFTGTINLGTRVDVSESTGTLSIFDSTFADSVAMSHDGTDFNIVGTTTTDINITGITAIAAGTVNAIFSTVTASLTGNADTATALATGRTIGMTGDVAWTSTSFDGTGNVTGTSTIQPDAVTMDMIVDVATDTFLGRVTAATGTVEVLSNAQAKTSLDLTGTNTGDEPSASLTVQGIVELATITETNTGTDATRAVTPDGLDGWTGSAQFTTAGVLTATSYGGVTESDLLDKTAAESISEAWTFTGVADVILEDGVEARFGTGNDSRIYFDSSDTFFDLTGASNDFNLRVNGTDNAITAAPSGAVGLYWNALNKFNTVDHTATDQISGAELLDAEGNMQPAGVGVVINDATTFDTVATHTPFQQANATQTVYFVGAGAGTANFDTYADTGATQTNIPAGTMWYVQNNAATTLLVIRGGTSVTIRFWAGTGAPADADVTVARGGVATVRKVSDTIYDVWGIGLS